jgi:hypothetical protein
VKIGPKDGHRSSRVSHLFHKILPFITNQNNYAWTAGGHHIIDQIFPSGREHDLNHMAPAQSVQLDDDGLFEEVRLYSGNGLKSK